MATYELEAKHKHQFPATPGWGQAGFQELGNVKEAAGGEGINKGSSKDAGPEGGGQNTSSRPKRAVKRNPRALGPEWIQPKQRNR